ncbi:MAG: hypothetical protein V4572_10060 [Bacteroidota bacterium]
MDKELLINQIIEKINYGYIGYEIEDFLKRKEIDPKDYKELIDIANSRIYEHKLKTLPLRNTIIYISFIVLTLISFYFFYFHLPEKIESEDKVFLPLLGAILTSCCICYTVVFHNSWKKEYMDKIDFQSINYSFFVALAFIPSIILYFVISFKFDSTAKEMLIKNKIEVLGTVISLEGKELTNLKGQSIDISSILVEFETLEGQKITISESISKYKLSNYYVGQEINMLYSKTNPQNIELLTYDTDVRDYMGTEERRIEIKDLFNLFAIKQNKVLGVLNNISYGWKYNIYKKIWINQKRNIAIAIDDNTIKCISDDFATFSRQLSDAGFKSQEEISNTNTINAYIHKEYVNDTFTITIERISSKDTNNQMMSLTTITKKTSN